MPPFGVVLTRHLLSAITVADDAAAPLPTEFLIFPPGAHESSKGTYTFDAESARAIMSRYQTKGVDMMADLEHDSLSDQARLMRSDAGDAMAWYKLQLRTDGSLWATDVQWSAEGARRLREKLQRYISPAFLADKKTGQIVRLLNVALCADPATYDATPLVAASGRDLRTVQQRVIWYCTKVKALAKATQQMRDRHGS